MRGASLLLLLVLVATSSSALTITDAKIAKGAVQVKGKGAVPGAAITWDGVPVAMASKAGAFRFATATLPDDCTGDVADGTASAPAIVAGCTRTSSRSATVVDANGVALGPYQLDRGDPLTADHVLFGSPSGPVAVELRLPGWFTPFDGNRIDAEYATPDCSGPPYTQPFDSGPYAGAIIPAFGVAGGVAYYRPKFGGAPTTLQSSGYFGLVYACPNEAPALHGVCCCQGCGGGLVDAAPMGTIDVGAYVPPLRVELR